MITFNVTLDESDLKKFISHKMGLKTAKIILPFTIYTVAIIIMLIAEIFTNAGIIGLCIITILLFMLIFWIYKIYSTFQIMFVKSLDIVGKQREFTIDKRSLHIIYGKNANLSGKYPIYNIENYIKLSHAYYIIFKDKIYIIIPRRFLDDSQDKQLNSILKEAYPQNKSKAIPYN